MIAKRKEDFWYGIPAGLFGSSRGGETYSPYVIVDAERIFDAVEYFQKHKRSVVVLGTRLPVQSHSYAQNAVRIDYTFKARG